MADFFPAKNEIGGTIFINRDNIDFVEVLDGPLPYEGLVRVWRKNEFTDFQYRTKREAENLAALITGLPEA